MRADDEGPLDPLLSAVAEELKRPVAVRPDLARRVLAEAQRPAWDRAARWLTRPRSVALSPLGGLALAAGLAGIFLLAPERPPAPPVAAATVAAPIQFVLRAPGAQTVALVGDFNDWDPTATLLRPTAGATGIWTIEIPLAAGHHEYAFVVDGARWLPDPASTTQVTDEFDRPNSIVTVTRS